jgi:hypothetical protein
VIITTLFARQTFAPNNRSSFAATMFCCYKLRIGVLAVGGLSGALSIYNAAERSIELPAMPDASARMICPLGQPSVGTSTTPPPPPL